jgi:hypothetical protein
LIGCLSAEKVSRTSNPPNVVYRVDLRIVSRARRVAQRAKGAWIYLIDDQGRRYTPEPDSSAVPLDVLLQPDKSVTTPRTFRVPAGVQRLGLITGHGRAYRGAMAFLVMGQSGGLFKKPAIIRMQ